MKTKPAPTREEIVKADPLGEFFVWWDDLTSEDVKCLEAALLTATGERTLQRFLQQVPLLLVQHLGGGHGRWVIPQKKLGAEHVTDFIVGEAHSFGHEWTAVELESPKAKMFTKTGNPSKELTHAIRQIQDWRAWLKRNQDYAARPRTQSGLGLQDIDSNIPGLVLIGRHESISPATDDLRRQMCQDLNIKIHSYDTLIGWAKARVKWCEQQQEKRRQNKGAQYTCGPQRIKRH
jgi:hypothetical protein